MGFRYRNLYYFGNIFLGPWSSFSWEHGLISLSESAVYIFKDDVAVFLRYAYRRLITEGDQSIVG